jgi:phosphopantothenoylcysteine decarboxylase / phosphopantothenate---cysteine ligase
MLKSKKIVIGVTGGIAAYKIPLLIRELKKAKAEVKVVMTPAAAKFVNPITLAALSQNEVVKDTFPDNSLPTIKAETWHINLGEWADLMLIAPATANTIAKLTFGIADNPVTIVALSARCPVMLSPSMDTYMWENISTQDNIAKLQERSYRIIPPEVGKLASGLTGKGRLPEIKKMIKSLNDYFINSVQDLNGVDILVTAGPTREPIDPVRFIGNRSSGKMGFSIAKAASDRGANVTLIAGPTYLETPRKVKRINVETASNMYKAVLNRKDKSKVIIMAAAVADFTPESILKEKIKKENLAHNVLTLKLKKTEDILEILGSQKRLDKVLVGFALETNDGIRNAKTKLRNKNLDLIVLNNPLQKGAAFEGNTNIVTLISKLGKSEKLPRMTKYDVADKILDRVVSILKAKKHR